MPSTRSCQEYFPTTHQLGCNPFRVDPLFDLHAEGKINPEISDRFSLKESAAAIAHLKDRKAKGKVIIDV